jgi:hypothetical protein
MTGTQDKRRPGLSVQLGLEGMPEADQLPFLAHAEQRAKQEGNLEMLRAIKDYRLMLNRPSTKPPEDD